MAGEYDQVPLGELCVNHDARRVPIKGSDRQVGPFPYYGASGVIDRVNNYLFDGEYLLVAEDGENLRTRQTPVAFLATGKFWVNNHAHIIEGNQRARTKYLAYGLKAADISPYLTGAVMPKLTQANLALIPIFLPDLNDQDAIVEVLGSLDDKIGLNQRMVTTLEKIAQAVFKSWFVNFDPVRAKSEGRPSNLAHNIAAIFPSSFGDDGVPDGWRFGSVAELLETNPTIPLRAGIDAPYVDMAALPTFGPTISGFVIRAASSGSRFKRGDTLVARITPCLENGKTALVDFLPEGAVGWGSTEFIVLRPANATNRAFPYLLARHEPFRAHLIGAMTGSSGRQRVPSIAVAAWEMALPPDEVLTAFGSLVEPIFDRIRIAADESAKLRDLRNTLLPKLVSGELRIKDAKSTVEAA